MRLLVTAPTDAEIQPLLFWLGSHAEQTGEQKYRFRSHHIVIKTTGVGAVATAFHLSQALQHEGADLVVQLGLAGSFDRNFSIGEVVVVARDRLADLGAEDHEEFMDLFALGLASPDCFPFEQGWLVNPHLERISDLPVPRVSGITVQTVSGSASTIARRTTLYHPQVETMEGAAFHYVCLFMQVPFLQLRAISNHVEPRDKSKWNIPLALENLHQVFRNGLGTWIR